MGIREFNRNQITVNHVSFLLKCLTFSYDSETSVGSVLWKDVMSPAICRQLPGPASPHLARSHQVTGWKDNAPDELRVRELPLEETAQLNIFLLQIRKPRP